MFGSRRLRGFEFFEETEEDMVCYETMLVTNKRLLSFYTSTAGTEATALAANGDSERTQ